MTRLGFNRQFALGLEQERTRLNITQKQMAEHLDLSLSAYKRLVAGETEKIDLYIGYRLYKLTGKLTFECLELTDPHLILKRKISGLSPSQLVFIDALVEFEKSFAHSTSDAEDFVTVFIPTGNMEDGMIYDSANVRKLDIAKYRRMYGDQISCGIQITSDHLHPVYHRDDVLLIARRPVRDGDTGVFFDRHSGRTYIRRFHQGTPCRLESLNGYGQDLFFDAEAESAAHRWHKIGCVVAKIR